jgi:signal transduction histidine kinase
MEISTSNATRHNRDWVIVFVQDTGVGIPQLEQAAFLNHFILQKEIKAEQVWAFR